MVKKSSTKKTNSKSSEKKAVKQVKKTVKKIKKTVSEKVSSKKSKFKDSDFDVAKHVLIPKHTKLSDAQKETLFKAYNVTNKELPKILINDPAIQHLDPKIGDIIKIERNSSTAKNSVFYRGVINE